jgi:hypothetical protein
MSEELLRRYIINYHLPRNFYDSIPLLLSFYNETFKDIVICGPKPFPDHYIMVLDFGPGRFGYECASEAIRRYADLKNLFGLY